MVYFQFHFFFDLKKIKKVHCPFHFNFFCNRLEVEANKIKSGLRLRSAKWVKHKKLHRSKKTQKIALRASIPTDCPKSW